MQLVVVKFPSYYVEPKITGDDIKRVRSSWNLIIEDTSAEYHVQKSTIEASSCWAWFYNAFYDHLFEVAPEVRSFFKNMSSQGRALVKMISTMFGLFNNMHTHSSTEKSTLEGLAKRHAGYGILGTQYSIFGEVLLWTLKKVLGAEFTDEVERSWLHMYCFMLKIVLPAAAKAENRILIEGKGNEDIHWTIENRIAHIMIISTPHSSPLT